MLTGPPPKFHGTRDILSGEEGKVSQSLSAQPISETALQGTITYVVVSSPCGGQGSATIVPVTLTRTGDVPAGIHMANPVLFADPTAWSHP